MRVRLTLILCFVLALSATAAAQYSIKLFDATPVAGTGTVFSFETATPFATTEVYLYCETEFPQSSISGSEDGVYPFIVDNFLTVNDVNVCPDQEVASVDPFLITAEGQGNCFSSLKVDANLLVPGLPASEGYNGVGPVDVSGDIVTSGYYTFKLMDYGFVSANSDIYLHTTCSIHPPKATICHRDMGKPGWKTISVGTASVQAHLNHGDYEGPCVP
jgi:hypothetical protein